MLNRSKGGQFALHAMTFPRNSYDGHMLATIIPDMENIVAVKRSSASSPPQAIILPLAQSDFVALDFSISRPQSNAARCLKLGCSRSAKSLATMPVRIIHAHNVTEPQT